MRRQITLGGGRSPPDGRTGVQGPGEHPRRGRAQDRGREDPLYAGCHHRQERRAAQAHARRARDRRAGLRGLRHEEGAGRAPRDLRPQGPGLRPGPGRAAAAAPRAPRRRRARPSPSRPPRRGGRAHPHRPRLPDPEPRAAAASRPPTDQVKVHYRGTLIDGTEFDSSLQAGPAGGLRPAGRHPLLDRGRAAHEGGGKAKLVCPSEIAYGDRGGRPRSRPAPPWSSRSSCSTS